MRNFGNNAMKLGNNDTMKKAYGTRMHSRGHGSDMMLEWNDSSSQIQFSRVTGCRLIMPQNHWMYSCGCTSKNENSAI